MITYSALDTFYNFCLVSENGMLKISCKGLIVSCLTKKIIVILITLSRIQMRLYDFKFAPVNS